jgi:hypothetical protein
MSRENFDVDDSKSKDGDNGNMEWINGENGYDNK